MLIDFYNVLETFIPSLFAAIILLTIGAVVFSVSGKWKSFFFSHKEYIKTVVFLLTVIIVFFLIPDSNLQKYFRSGILVVTAFIVFVKIYGKEHVIFPKNILLKHWGKIFQIKGTRRYKVLYVMLSTYEKIHVGLEEIKSYYQKAPYMAYCELKKMNIEQWNPKDQNTYYHMLCAILIELGAYLEAKGVLKKLLKNESEDLVTLSLQCVLYESTGNVQLAMEVARKAYQNIIIETGNVEPSVITQIYHNYACLLIRDYQINKGLDIMKDAADYALKEGKSVILDRTVGDYLKLLIQYFPKDSKIEEYIKKYDETVTDNRDRCLSYINMRLFLIQMNYQKENLADYLTYVYELNRIHFKGEERCFFCLSCMNVAFAHSMDIDNYLRDILEVMKDECKSLDVLKRVRFYNGLSNVVDFYPVQCENNHYSISEHYGEMVQLYNEYCDNLEQKELYQALECTDSIWINQKCELRKMIIQHQKRKIGYDFDTTYKQYMQLYRERESNDSVMDMLNINMDIVDECMRDIVDRRAPLELVRSAKKEILLEHLMRVESLLDKINYDVIRAEYAIRISKGYYFAGEMGKAKEYISLFEESRIPETFLLEWDKENYRMLKSFLKQ